MKGNPATFSVKHIDVPKQKRRWLLWLARQCYFWFLRANGWRSQLLPSPLKGGGMVRKWTRVINSRRYMLTTEEALEVESKRHQLLQRAGVQQG